MTVDPDHAEYGSVPVTDHQEAAPRSSGNVEQAEN